MKTKFIFSTYYYGGGESSDYVFSKQCPLGKDSKILEFLIEKLDDKFWINLIKYINGIQGLWEEVKTEYVAMEKNIGKDPKVAEDSFNKHKKEGFKNLKRITNLKKAVAIVSKHPRFSYYIPENVNNGTNCAYAVPCLPSDLKSLHQDWIKALILDNTLEKIDEGGTLYLILHDKDLPSYDGETFKILTADEIEKIEISGNKDGGLFASPNGRNIFKFNNFEIRIIVFNHVDNAIIPILLKKYLDKSDIAKKIEGIYKNLEQLEQSEQIHYEKDFFSKFDTSDYFDIGNNKFFEDFLEKGKGCYYIYSDKNGALFTELMHTKIDIRKSKEWIKLIEHLKKPALKNQTIDDKEIKKMNFPIIIRTYLDFFKKWEDSVEDDKKKASVHNHSNKKAMDKNLERALSFFNNSSIWVRLVDINDKTAFKIAENEFNYFRKIGLYDYDSAWENLEYNLRILSENYLKSTSNGHGNYVTPILYGNEAKARKILVGNHKSTKQNPEPQTRVPPLENNTFLKKLGERIKTIWLNLFKSKYSLLS